MMFSDLLAAGLDALSGFDRDAALDAGVSPARVREWAGIHAAYYGPTKFTRKQADARHLAAGQSLDVLGLIERKLARVDDQALKWQLRLDLLRYCATSSGRYDALARRADRLIDSPKPAPKKTMRFSPPRRGMRSVHWTHTERKVTDLEMMLRNLADSDHPLAAELSDLFADFLFDPAGPSVPVSAPRPIMLLPFPAWTRIQSGTGDDITLHMTDGTTMTGAEFLAQEFGEVLEVAAFHPVDGAVNLYRTQRFANAKQRDLAKLLMPVCPVPGCRHSADACQIHHVQPWKHGGETNMDNLSPLCPYHNGVHDDDPWLRKRGHIEIRAGTPVWVSPRGYPVPADTPGAMDLLFNR